MSKRSSGAGGIIKINTQSVRSAASTLKSINNSIEADFVQVQRAMSILDDSWDGSASRKAISHFNKLKADFCGSNGRKAVMDNYIRFLEKTVAQDYETTENTNINLSELFK